MLPRVFVHTDSFGFANGRTREAKGDAGDNGGFVSQPREHRESVVPVTHLSDLCDAGLRSHRYEGDLSVRLFVRRARQCA